jgi:DNA-binding MarR family transcriptional regulator
MPESILRALESHAGAVGILVFLFGTSDGRAYRKRIEHEVYIGTATVVRTLTWLTYLGLIKDEIGLDARWRPLRFYMLTENGRRVAKILWDAERALEAEQKTGALKIDPEA